MRYGKNIVEKIIEELHKVPNIRHVCSKVGIDHSTFYRWMVKHFEFHKGVEAALLLGRKNINDAAESVIINGIQKGEFNSAKYWLSHNEERYVEAKQVRYFQYLEYWHKAFLREKESPDSQFEEIFNLYSNLEKDPNISDPKIYIEDLLNIMCRTDPKLKEIFYSTYEEWKLEKDKLR